MSESRKIRGLEYDIETWEDIVEGNEAMGLGTVAGYMCDHYQKEIHSDSKDHKCRDCPLFKVGKCCLDPKSAHGKYLKLVAIVDKAFNAYNNGDTDEWVENGESLFHEIQNKHAIDILLAANAVLQTLKGLESYQKYNNIF